MGTGLLLPAPALAAGSVVPGLAPTFPPAAGGSVAPGAADAPTAAKLPRAERKVADGLTIPLAAAGGAAGPGTALRALAARVAVAGIPTTVPANRALPSRPIPGRKIRPRHPLSRNIPAAPRRILPRAADGPSRPGEALCGPEPATPTAMCRPPALPTRLRLVRRGQAVPSGPVRPIPLRQERLQKAPRRSNPTALGQARQEQGHPASPPVTSTAPAIPGAAAR